MPLRSLRVHRRSLRRQSRNLANKPLESDAPRSRSLFLNSRFYVRSVASQLIRSAENIAHLVMKLLRHTLLVVTISLVFSSCDRSSVEESRVELYVFKVQNIALREAIRKDDSFRNISFEGNAADYAITLVAEADTKEKADMLLESVKDFALSWGKDPNNQTWFHPDDGFDADGNRKYKRVIEDAVKLIGEDSLPERN